MYRSLFDARKLNYVVFNFSQLKLTLQRKMINLYDKFLQLPQFRTKTLFIIDKEKKTQIISDFDSIFIPEVAEEERKFKFLRRLGLPVTGKSNTLEPYFTSKNVTIYVLNSGLIQVLKLYDSMNT